MGETAANGSVKTERQESSELMRSVIDSLGVGLAVFDGSLRLRLWSQALLALLGLPRDLVRYGIELEEIIRYCARRGDYGEGDVEQIVARRLARAKSSSGPLQAHCYQRRTAEGRVLEVHGTPLPDGGLLTTYIDMTERHEAAEQVRSMVHQDPLTGHGSRGA